MRKNTLKQIKKSSVIIFAMCSILLLFAKPTYAHNSSIIDNNSLHSENSIKISNTVLRELGYNSETEIKDIYLASGSISVQQNNAKNENTIDDYKFYSSSAVVINSINSDGLYASDLYVLTDGDGEPLASSSITSSVVNSALQGDSNVKIRCRYKLYTDGLIYVFVNPYSLYVQPKVSGVTYIAGDVMFHGIQAYTSNFQDIPGTDCSFATKSVVKSSGITVGTKYYSTIGYFYSGQTKALRVYSCGFHSGSSMYLEYKKGGKTYSGVYTVQNI